MIPAFRNELPWSTLVELARHRAASQPHDRAFTWLGEDGEETCHLTYADLDARARGIAACLQQRGLAGERALLVYPPGLDFIIGFFGCLYAGVLAVPVYPPDPARLDRSLAKLRGIVADAAPALILTTDLVAALAAGLADEHPDLAALPWLSTESGMPEAAAWQPPTVESGDIAFLQYTSGSTGLPKGVMVTHGNLLHNSEVIRTTFGHDERMVGVGWLPLYHDMGLIGYVIQPLYMGCPSYLMAPHTFLRRPVLWLAAISRYGGTSAGGPNFAYDLCRRKITPAERQHLDLGTWRVAFNGAEPLHADTMERFAETFAPQGFRRDAFLPCYGLAEATLCVTGANAGAGMRPVAVDGGALGLGRIVPADADAPGARSLVSSGFARGGQQVRIVDPRTRRTMPAGRIGEIWVSGPSVAQGYWRQEALTAETFRARPDDAGEDAFLRTGDLGALYGQDLIVTGRLKDLIILNGVNHYPQDIERLVDGGHAVIRPGCTAAFAVTGDQGEQVVALAEVASPAALAAHGPETVAAAVRQRLWQEAEIPLHQMVFVNRGALLKTSSGKIQRSACREAWLKGYLDVLGTVSAVPAPARIEPVAAATPPAAGSREDAILLRVRQVLAKVSPYPFERLTADRRLVSELGLDSLMLGEVATAVGDAFPGLGPLPYGLLGDDPAIQALACHVAAHWQGDLSPETAVAAVSVPAAEQQGCLDDFPEVLAVLERLSLPAAAGVENPYFQPHERISGGLAYVGGQERLNFASYNYLGLSGHPAVSDAAKAAIERYGTSVSGSRLTSGEKALHRELEGALAAFLGCQDVLVMVGGHATNVGVIGHLVGPADVIVHDGLIHDSILAGAALSGARRLPFPHNDLEALDRMLGDLRAQARRVLIAVEGVYSMDGDRVDLPRLVAIKRRHRALLYVDEAHSFGVLGRTGRGIAEAAGVAAADVDVWMGTLSKSMASCGGYIGGSKALIAWLKYSLGAFVFSVGISPANAAAALAALRVLRAEPERVARLQANSRLFLGLCREAGIDTGLSDGSAVVPCIVGDTALALRLADELGRRGVNVQPVIHPAVEHGQERLRFFMTATHTHDQIVSAVATLAEAMDALDPALRRRTGEASELAVHG